MPSLRKRLSLRNLLDLGNGKEQEQAHEIADDAERRPKSAVEGTYGNTQHDLFYDDGHRPYTAYSQPNASARNRFSLSRHKHASEPELFKRFKADAADADDVEVDSCPAPVIGITAPTWDIREEPLKHKSTSFSLKQKARRSISYNSASDQPSAEQASRSRRLSFSGLHASFGRNGSGSGSMSRNQSLAPSPATNDTESATSSRPSEDRYGGLPASSENLSSTGKLFKLPRRKKRQPESLFPLPVHLSPSNPKSPASTTQTPTIFPVQPSPAHSAQSVVLSPFDENAKLPSTEPITRTASPILTRSTSYQLNGESSVSFETKPPTLLRHSSTNSVPVDYSSKKTLPSTNRHPRGRSGTETSMSSHREDERESTPWLESVARTSMTSTTLGRNSIAQLRSLTSRFRHPSESQSPRHSSPGGLASKNGSFAFKETITVPDREEGESAAQYYVRLERDFPKKNIAMILSKSADPFSHDVLRSLLRTFKFYEEPLDISLRKFLWEIDLPGEAQQIDRVISAFAEMYYECMPPLFNNFDETYLAAYSLIILHSDLFNKSNRRKMLRSEYQKNTGGHGIDEEILGYFYDNIQYTEFVKQQQDDDESFGRPKKGRPRKKVRKVKVSATENGEKSNVDPYDFILNEEQKLEVLRPALKGVMNLDDTFSFTGTLDTFDIRHVRGAFARSCILQTISTRSRPEAFTSPSTIDNPDETNPGVVEIKVAKVGILWRKDPKKKTARSPWQEWGAMLTQSQLHFFRNKDWIKDLMKQVDSHKKAKQSDTIPKQARFNSVIFRPQIEDFKPEYSVRTTNALALQDVTYDKHKHGFVLLNYDGLGSDEVVLAESEVEMNDWLLKINFAASFAAAKIDMQAALTPGKVPLIRLVSTPAADSPAAPTHSRTASAEDIDVTSLTAIPGVNNVSQVRNQAIATHLQTLEFETAIAQHKLDDHLKTARHLQILAPFPPRTRSDLLSYAARVAHRVRWTRFDLWRLKIRSAMLKADRDAGDVANDNILGGSATIAGKSSAPKLLPGALSRLNSKASGILNQQKNTRSGQHGLRPPAASRLASSASSELAGGIDQAFATPSDTLSRSEALEEGPWQLPPLTLGPEPITIETERPESSGTESLVRLSSFASGLSPSTPTNLPSATPSIAGNVDDTVNVSDHVPTNSVESEKERNEGVISQQSRVSNRRSLHRQTLRDSRDITTYPRNRRAKESVSSTGNDDASSTQEIETLTRAAGSFTLHGKKASVITLGTEFQHMTPEERLKARKQALAPDTDTDIPEANRKDISSLLEVQPEQLKDEIDETKPETNTPPLVPGSWPGWEDNDSFEDEDRRRRSSSTAIGDNNSEKGEEGVEQVIGHHSANPSTYFDADDFARRSEERSSSV